MKKILFDCSVIEDPYLALAAFLEIDPDGNVPLKKKIINYAKPAILEIFFREEGIRKWPKFIDFLEEVSQKNRWIFVIWGPKKVEMLIANDQANHEVV
ncbi:hypothetical protein C815_00633 [Firmicutes bacterium M10-2]|nr:hypothetical protein C815_00633 [Firmicutes bacterium M10-2]